VGVTVTRYCQARPVRRSTSDQGSRASVPVDPFRDDCCCPAAAAALRPSRWAQKASRHRSEQKAESVPRVGERVAEPQNW